MTDLITITRKQLQETIREEQAIAWDKAVASLTYEDGTPVDVAANTNPYRSRDD